MANYKSIETLKKDFEVLTDDLLNEIVDCPDVDVSSLTDREKFSCLVFQQMNRALENKSYKLMLDCNYPQSNKHNKSEKQLAKGQEPEWLVDYYRLVSKEGKQKSLIQIYVKANPKAGTCKFSLCTSCAKDNLAQFIALRDELQFEPVGKKGGEGTKTTKRDNVDYTELVGICKSVAAILSTTAKAREAAKAKKEEETSEE